MEAALPLCRMVRLLHGWVVLNEHGRLLTLRRRLVDVCPDRGLLSVGVVDRAQDWNIVLLLLDRGSSIRFALLLADDLSAEVLHWLLGKDGRRDWRCLLLLEW